MKDGLYIKGAPVMSGSGEDLTNATHFFIRAQHTQSLFLITIHFTENILEHLLCNNMIIVLRQKVFSKIKTIPVWVGFRVHTVRFIPRVLNLGMETATFCNPLYEWKYLVAVFWDKVKSNIFPMRFMLILRQAGSWFQSISQQRKIVIRCDMFWKHLPSNSAYLLYSDNSIVSVVSSWYVLEYLILMQICWYISCQNCVARTLCFWNGIVN